MEIRPVPLEGLEKTKIERADVLPFVVGVIISLQLWEQTCKMATCMAHYLLGPWVIWTLCFLCSSQEDCFGKGAFGFLLRASGRELQKCERTRNNVATYTSAELSVFSLLLAEADKGSAKLFPSLSRQLPGLNFPDSLAIRYNHVTEFLQMNCELK